MNQGRQVGVFGIVVAMLIGTTIFAVAGSPPATAATPSVQPITPARLFESRLGEKTIDGQYAGVGRVAAGSITEVQVAGRAGVPKDASAAFINLTSIIPGGTNYLTAFPCGDVPNVSNLNSPPNDIRANGVFVRLSAKGTVCVYTVAATDFLIDIFGYVPAGGSPTGITPARLFESRAGENTIDGQYNGVGRVAAGSVTEVQVAGRAGVPKDATAALINLTSIIPDGTNYLTAFPCGDVPNVSNLNTPPDDIRANSAFVRLSAKGTVCVYTVAATDFLIDIFGYVPAGGSPTGITPARLFESRAGENTIDGQYNGVGRVAAGSVTEVQVAGRAGVPKDATAALINLTSIIPDGTNYLTAFPCGDVPNVSNLNTPPDDIRANSAFVKLSATGTVCIYTVAATDFLIDINGYVPNSNGTSVTTTTSTTTAPPKAPCVVNGTNVATSIPSTECDALIAFYNSTGGPNWDSNTGWLTPTDPCKWKGVFCRDGHVDTISLPFNDLTGVISPQISQLTKLTSLSVSFSKLTGLPDEITQLQSLEYLDLMDNLLPSLPNGFDNMKSLKRVDLSGNKLTAFPSELLSVTSLTWLDLSRNSIPEIPAEIGQLTNLTLLGVASNSLTAVPPEVGQLTNLTALLLDYNTIKQVPPEIGKLTKLNQLWLGNNRLTSIPSSMKNLVNLKTLYLQDNALKGDLTEVFTPLQNANIMKTLELRDNLCLTANNSALRNWLTGLDPEWNAAC